MNFFQKFLSFKFLGLTTPACNLEKCMDLLPTRLLGLMAAQKKVLKCLPDKMLMNLGAKIGLD